MNPSTYLQDINDIKKHHKTTEKVQLRHSENPFIDKFQRDKNIAGVGAPWKMLTQVLLAFECSKMTLKMVTLKYGDNVRN